MASDTLDRAAEPKGESRSVNPGDNEIWIPGEKRDTGRGGQKDKETP